MAVATNTESVKQIFETLESSMVRIFRLCQSLFCLAKDERGLLVDGKAAELQSISEKKARLIDELESAEQFRQKIADQIARILCAGKKFLTLSDLLSSVDFDRKDEIIRLQHGILALQTDIREVNSGNYALAMMNLQQLEAVQGFFVNLVYSPSTYYSPPTAPQSSEPPTTWGMDHKA
jgi:flagellar biosynthesis/type III secretory pathway chaperone